MAIEDIARIAMTVAVVQFTCDALAYWRIYSTEAYKRVLAAYERAEWKKNKAIQDAQAAGVDPQNPQAVLKKTGSTTKGKKPSGNNKATRAAQALERATQDCHDAAARVSHKHMFPNMMTSLLFVLLLRILGTEYQGQILGILPFCPWKFIHRMTGRGLEFDDQLSLPDNLENPPHTFQAVSFTIIYVISALSAKYYVHQMFGTSPPAAADGLTGLAQSTWGKNVLKSVGLDPNDLKME